MTSSRLQYQQSPNGADFTALPPDLPVPADDGRARHLMGIKLPDLSLPSSHNTRVTVGGQRGKIVLYCFPMIGTPGVELPHGWNEEPGARGCTVQSLVYSQNILQLNELGTTVFGVSNQSPQDQAAAAVRLALRQVLLSDVRGKLQAALKLPTFELMGRRYLRRLTIGAVDGKIERVWYPVYPPGRDVEDVRRWLVQ